jgi:hypothetical protein
MPPKQVAYGIQRVEGALPALLRLAQGGTAVGTGLNTKKGYDVAVAKQVGRGDSLGVCRQVRGFIAVAFEAGRGQEEVAGRQVCWWPPELRFAVWVQAAQCMPGWVAPRATYFVARPGQLRRNRLEPAAAAASPSQCHFLCAWTALALATHDRWRTIPASHS